MNYAELMMHLESLKPCALITTGRTGSDFLQSLLDSHTEVLTFNGIFLSHIFWEKSKCVNKRNDASVNLSDLLDEFIGLHIEKFKSRYDYIERKDCLGVEGNQSIQIDLNKFKFLVMRLLKEVDFNSKNFMLAVYGGYAICLGQDLIKKKLLLHHMHHIEKIPNYMKDFPNSKILCMTRDPRANFVSGILHHRLYNVNNDNGGHLLFYIKRIIIDAYSADKYSDDVMTLKIEDLGDKCALVSLCSWLGINYEETMKKSTWGGLLWRGDRVSTKENKEVGWSAKMLDNDWEGRLSFKDKYIFNFLMNDRLVNYKYKSNKVYMYDYFIIPIILCIPLEYELRFFSLEYLKQCIKRRDYQIIAKNCIYYVGRVIFFYKVYFRKVLGFRFSRKYINCE
jgi:hypothetical protein